MTAPAGLRPRPRFDIADIVRAHRDALAATVPLNAAQKSVLSAIALCRTAALGGFVDRCRKCGHEHPAYNSCRNRHCPKCQALAQEQWIASRAERILPVRHFHVVFTFPEALRPLCLFAPADMYGALMQTAARTLLDLIASRWDATPGITSVLHTWTRDLRLHPHVHMLVTAGGLSSDGTRWVSRERYLFPFDMMRVVFAAKVLDALREMHKRGVFAGYDPFRDPDAFDKLLAGLAHLKWAVHTDVPFSGAGHVLKYLGRYTHRVAISNSRLLDVADDAVTFSTRDSKRVTLRPVEFLRRFLLHVLPDGFHKIRHYALYSGAQLKTHRATARRLLTREIPAALMAHDKPADSKPSTWADQLRELTGRDVRVCPRCGGPIERVPAARAPPALAV